MTWPMRCTGRCVAMRNLRLLVNLVLWIRMAIDGEEPQALARPMERVAVSV